MALSLKHNFQSAKQDGTDPTLIQPSNWNDEHQIFCGTAKILGRTTAGAGSVEEVSIGGGLSLSAGTLSFSGNNEIAGYPVAVNSPVSGDMLEFSASTWTNTGKIQLTDGGNF